MQITILVKERFYIILDLGELDLQEDTLRIDGVLGNQKIPVGVFDINSDTFC